MKLIMNLLKKYRSFIAYAVFGVFTTLVNIVTYNICYVQIGMDNTLSNMISWVFAVTFAYLTNKVWVFDSRSWDWSVLIKEVPVFISCRLATGIMDLVIMFVSVDLIKADAMIMKILSNILVIILNYIFSKLVIFKKNNLKDCRIKNQ